MIKALTVMVKAFLLEKKKFGRLEIQNLGDYNYKIWAIRICESWRLRYNYIGR